MPKTAFKIVGMCCAEEVATLRAELAPLEGVRELSFDILNAKLTVDFDESRFDTECLRVAVKRTGMTAKPWISEGEVGAASTPWAGWGRTALAGLSGAMIVVGFLAHAGTSGIRAAVSDGRPRAG